MKVARSTCTYTYIAGWLRWEWVIYVYVLPITSAWEIYRPTQPVSLNQKAYKLIKSARTHGCLGRHLIDNGKPGTGIWKSPLQSWYSVIANLLFIYDLILWFNFKITTCITCLSYLGWIMWGLRSYQWHLIVFECCIVWETVMLHFSNFKAYWWNKDFVAERQWSTNNTTHRLL